MFQIYIIKELHIPHKLFINTMIINPRYTLTDLHIPHKVLINTMIINTENIDTYFTICV